MACLSPSELEAFLLGSLSDAEWRRAREHMTGCDHCRRALAPLAAPSGTPAPSAAAAADLPRPAPPPGLALGPYRILGEIGRGGQAQVYLAEDTRLGRKVALKVLSAWFAGSPATLRRFEREAIALSRLDHPNICAVYEAGELDGVPFIAMRHVEGETLAARIAAAPREAPPDRAEMVRLLTLVERAARALHFAHENGLVHRDVKPTNIMVTRDGEPMLLDFGLARAGGEESQVLTRTGDLMGTPAYIPPEQLTGRAPIDRRADVYALGVTLYQCLTLELPFEASSREALYRKVVGEPPGDPRRANPRVPRDLKVVIETALEKRPERRYPTALAFAEDLRRVRDHEPIHARPAGPVLRARKWVERNPVIAAAAAAVFLFLSIGLGVSLFSLARMKIEERDKDAAITALREERDARDTALAATRRALRYADGLRLAALARGLVRANAGQALLVALEAHGREPGLWSRNALLAALASLREERTLTGHLADLSTAAFSPDGKRVVTAAYDETARVWDVETGKTTALLGHEDGVTCAAFSRDGEKIVTGGQDGTARVWQASTGFCLAVLALHRDGIVALDVSPDGDRVATASRNGTAKSWSLRSLDESCALEGHTANLTAVHFDPQGKRLLTAGGDAAVRIWDARQPRLLHVLRHCPASIQQAKWSPDGRWILATSSDCGLVWDTATGALAARLQGQPLPQLAIAWSPDNRWAVTSSGDRGAAVWECGSWQPVAALAGHEGSIHDAEFSGDGRWLVTASHDRTARLWETPSFRPAAVLGGHGHVVIRAGFSPDSTRVVSASVDGTARLWRTGGPAAVPLLAGHQGPVTCAAYSPDGRFVATGSEDRAVRLWDAGGRPLARLGDHAERVTTVQWSADAKILLAGSPLDIKAWAVPGGKEILALRTGQWITEATLSPRGDCVAVSNPDGSATVWSLEGRRLVHLQVDGQSFTNMCFSPDGERIASSLGNQVRLWCPRTGKTLAEFTLATAYFNPLVFSPDGRQLLAAGNTEAPVLDAETGKILSLLGGWEGLQVSGSFSPDGARFLMRTVSEKFARIWNSRTGRTEVFLKGHQDIVEEARWSPDGRLVITRSPDRTARLWEAATGKELLTIEHEQWVHAIAFNPEGTHVLTGSADGVARIWPIDPVPVARALRLRALTPAERDQFEIGTPAERRLEAAIQGLEALLGAGLLGLQPLAALLPCRELAAWAELLDRRPAAGAPRPGAAED
jgi:WD40 repeat protein